MAAINPPGYLQNAGATHTAEQMRNWQNALVAGKTGATALLARGGVHPGLGNALTVTQTGSPSMAVIVKSGHGVIPGSEGSKQGSYIVMNDADVTLSIAAAHATLNRIDIVCFKVEDQAYSGAVNSSSLVVVTGTPASSPAAPTPPNNSITLAQVSIVANDTSITNNEITDKRQILAGVGGLISVLNQAERDALVGYESLAVYRRDTDAIETYDGSVWRSAWPIFRAAQVLGSPASSISFTGIPTTLRNIKIYVTARSTAAAAIAGLTLRVGGDSGANYKYQSMFAQNGSAPGNTSGLSNTSALVSYMPGATATAGAFSSCVLDLIGWERPHTNYLTGTSRGGYVDLVSNMIVNTTAITYIGSATLNQLSLQPDAGNLDTGTEVIIEGTYGP